MGARALRSLAFTCAAIDGVNCWPINLASSSGNRRATGEHAPTQIAALAIAPTASVSIHAATITMEISKYLRAPNFKNVDRAFSLRLGTMIAVTNSFGYRNVFRLPRMNSARGTCRVHCAERSSTFASSAISAGTPSAAGEALQIFPAMVPAF